MDAPEQRLVVYEDEDDLTHIFETVYNDPDERAAIKACVEDHGRQANVRSVDAKQYPPRAAA